MPTLKLLLRIECESGNLFGYVEISKKLAELVAKRREGLRQLAKQQGEATSNAPAIPGSREAYFSDKAFKLFTTHPAVTFFRPKEFEAWNRGEFAQMREDVDLSELAARTIFSPQMVVCETGIRWMFLDGETGELGETPELPHKLIQRVVQDPSKMILDKKTLLALYEEQQSRLEEELAQDNEGYEGEEIAA